MSSPGSATTTRLDQYERFVAHIRKQCVRDPGCRAALRRGLRQSPSEAITMHKTVAPWVPEYALDTPWERAYYTIAALIAAQPRTARDAELDVPSPNGTETDRSEPAEAQPPPRNLGASLARAVTTTDLRENTAESRLHLLVRQSTSGLHRHLPAVIRHLRADGVPVDWARLLNDLARWERYRDQIAKTWLQSFYRERAAAADASDSSSDNASPAE